MAGRIPQAFIDDLLERVDIVEVIERRLPLKKSGRNYSARCPFHDEKTPSFSVSPDKQFYYCFGCGAGGNAVGFVMDFDRVDFPIAVENLATLVGLSVPRAESDRRRPETERPQRGLYEILESAARFFREQLRHHPQATRAVDYLKGRGLTGEIARDFGIGYAPPGWDNLLQALAKDERDRQLLIDSGMVIVKEEDGRMYDRFRDRIMFPIVDNRGRVIAFGGRVLTDEKPKYLHSPETAVFHKGKELYGLYQARRAQRQLQKLIVVEGYMDVVALAQFGIPYAVATLGTATSTEHLKKVFRHCPEVIFCFDGDRAGRQAARRALEAALPAMENGRQARFLFLPEGEDPDSLVRKLGTAAFEQLLSGGQPLADYLFGALTEELDMDSLEGRARLGTLAAPLIGLIPEGIYKSLIFDALSDRTGLSSQRLTNLIQQTPPPTATANSSSNTTTTQPQRPVQRRPLPPRAEIIRNPTLYAIGLLLLHPRLARNAPGADKFGHLHGEPAQLLRDLLELLHKRPESNTHMLLGHWYDAPWRALITEAIDQAFYVPDTGAGEELNETLTHLRHDRIRGELDDLVDKLKGANYADLSASEKQQLHQLLSQKHSK
ncbi:MAG: DNA primase [Spongiibacteraceae bacterium]